MYLSIVGFTDLQRKIKLVTKWR